MNWLEVVGNWVVEHAVDIARTLWRMLEYVPPEYQAGLRVAVVVLSYLLVAVVGALAAYKLYRVVMAAIERVRHSVSTLAELAGSMLHRSVAALFERAIPAIFQAQTYARFLKWCSLTDREAISGFADGTRPQMVQQLLGFMVFLASVYAAVAFGCAVGFTFISQDALQIGAVSPYQWAGILTAAVLFALFIGAFDRSIAGSPRLFQLSQNTVEGTAQAMAGTTARLMLILGTVITTGNLRGATIVLIRLAVCWMSASFVSSVLVVWLFQASIQKQIDQAANELLANSFAATQIKRLDESKPAIHVNDSADCVSTREQIERLEQRKEEEAKIRFEKGSRKGSFVGPNYLNLEAEARRLDEKQKQFCPKTTPEQQTESTRIEGERESQRSQLIKQRQAEMAVQKRFDLAAGMKHAPSMPGYGMLYWLLFSLEMLVLASKLTLSSSYDDKLERLETSRRGNALT